MHREPVKAGDERAGLPSASEYERLLACRASYLLSGKAHALGQLAHQRSDAADLGTKKHLASIEGPDILSEREREDWQSVQRKREEFLKGWLGPSQKPFTSIKEERLWLRRGIRPLLSGKPDEIVKSGTRAAVLDQKFGSYRVADPAQNVQLSIYALLASREDEAIQEVTVQILSPYFDFESFTYTREELERLLQSVLVVLNSLSDPGDPTPGTHCQLCPARLICPAARAEAEKAALAKVIELPLGEPAAELLTWIKRAKALFAEIESHYKRELESTPGAIPGWSLVPGDVRRSIADPVQALERLSETFSVSEFLACCSPSVRMHAKPAPMFAWKLAGLRKRLYPETTSLGWSKSAGWQFWLERARESIRELIEIQDAYMEWLENLPENLTQGPTAEKLRAIEELDLRGAEDVLEEAEMAEIPLGFGRD